MPSPSRRSLGGYPVVTALCRAIAALPLLATLAACGGGGGGYHGPVAPTVTVTPAVANVTTTQPLAVGVTVAGGSGLAPTGTVTLTSGAFSSGAVALTAGNASVAVPAGVLAPPAGGLATASDTLTVSYTPSSASNGYLQAAGTATVAVSVGATPTVIASTMPVAVDGRPFQALPVGSSLLVSIAQDTTNAQTKTGIAVFNAPTPAQLNYACTQALASGVGAADGLTALPNSLDVALAVEDPGFEILNATQTVSNCGSGQIAISQGPLPANGALGEGTFAVAVTPDGKYAFVANEYGVVAQDSAGANILGNVGVVALQYDASGHVSGGTMVGQFSTGGQAIANVTLSPDGTRLYVTSEIAHPGVTVSGTANSTLAHGGCLQGAGSTAQTYGLLSVVDVAKAEATANASSIIATVAAGCSPVRVVETSDQQVIWVAARGDNAVLAFSTHMLESNPDAALLGSANTGGIAPVGLLLFHNQQLLAVANSNRFSNPNGGIPTVDGNMTIMSATPVSPSVLQMVDARLFPRNVNAAADDATLYLTDYYSDIVQVISTSEK